MPCDCSHSGPGAFAATVCPGGTSHDGRTDGRETTVLSFISEELIQSICRDRENEARLVRPHTEQRPAPERLAHESDQRRATPVWSAPALRNAVSQANC